MSDTPGAVEIPAENSAALTDAYEVYRVAAAARNDKKRKDAGIHLARLISAGRKAGWTVRLMASHTGVTSERLSQIVKAYDDGKPPRRGTPKFPVLEPVKPKKEEKPKSPRSHLTKREAKELLTLAKRASQNTGSRPLNSPYRKDSEKFSKLIIEYHERGVIWDEIAEASGLSFVGVRMRAARHGYGKGAPPSIKPYRRMVVHPVATKKEGDPAPAESPTKVA